MRRWLIHTSLLLQNVLRLTLLSFVPKGKSQYWRIHVRYLDSSPSFSSFLSSTWFLLVWPETWVCNRFTLYIQVLVQQCRVSMTNRTNILSRTQWTRIRFTVESVPLWRIRDPGRRAPTGNIYLPGLESRSSGLWVVSGPLPPDTKYGNSDKNYPDLFYRCRVETKRPFTEILFLNKVNQRLLKLKER